MQTGTEMNKSTEKLTSQIPENIELLEKGVRLVSLTFGFSLYTNEAFSDIPDAVLGFFRRYLEWCPPEERKFYGTENMKKHKPVTPRTVQMLATWLKPGAPSRDYVMLEIKNGSVHQEAPTFKCLVYGREKGTPSYDSAANMVSMAVPVACGFERVGDLLNLVTEVCASFPFTAGHAGFSFECSRYVPWLSEKHAWSKAMRHPGIDICVPSSDMRLIGYDAVKAPGWLTILSQTKVKSLGGKDRVRAALSAKVAMLDVQGGTILQAGPLPGFGDVNRNDRLPLYKEVYRVVAPLCEIGVKRYPGLAMPNATENSERWLRRFTDA
jgi:hypothetical protein